MKYVVLMYADPDRTKAMTAGERAQIADKHEEVRGELLASGELLNGAELVYPEMTRTLLGMAPRRPGPWQGLSSNSPPTTSSGARQPSERTRSQPLSSTATSPPSRSERSMTGSTLLYRTNAGRRSPGPRKHDHNRLVLASPISAALGPVITDTHAQKGSRRNVVARP
jgi:hypothetical protein